MLLGSEAAAVIIEYQLYLTTLYNSMLTVCPTINIYSH